MKQIFLFLFSIAIIMSSCTKESGPISFPPPWPPVADTLNLNATNWSDNGDGTFTCTFKNILNYSNNSYVTVFLKNEGYVTEISNSGISYKNGLLKSQLKDKDLNLIYEVGDGPKKIPFSSLDIKVVYHS